MALSGQKQWSIGFETSNTFIAPHKGGREVDQDWGISLVLFYNGTERFGTITLFGDGHGSRFNLAEGFKNRFIQSIEQYENDIFTLPQGSQFLEFIWNSLQQHLLNGTITNDEPGYDCGGSTVQLYLQCKPISSELEPFILYYNNGDSECVFTKFNECGEIETIPMSNFNWNAGGIFNETSGLWSKCNCQCTGCYLNKQIMKTLGTHSSKTYRYLCGDGAQKQENRWCMDFGLWRPPETCGFETQCPSTLTPQKWKDIQKIFSTPSVHTFEGDECHKWSCFQSSDGPFSHCAMPNLKSPNIPGDINDVIKFLLSNESIDFTQFATSSLNKVSHNFIPQRYKISFEELKTYSPHDLLNTFMEFYEANHGPKAIDDDWIAALREASDFIKQYDCVYNSDMPMNIKIKWLQSALTLCFSDDNCLFMFTSGFD